MVSERDFALLQEEVKCLRKKLGTTLNSAGGYADTLTSPGSSVYPNSYLENCGCVDVDTTTPDPLTACASQSEGLTPLGDMGSLANVTLGGVFLFDAKAGVLYKPADAENWENRNIGLADSSLEHGCVDVWWYRKATPAADNVILWRAGQSKILRSSNAGRTYWQVRTPPAPTGYDLGTIKFTQIQPDPFQINVFIALATNGGRTWLVRTDNDGQAWTWHDVTTYNGVTTRIPLRFEFTKNYIWLTCWADGYLTAMKVTNDPVPTPSAEYPFNAATWWEVDNKFEYLAPATMVDTGSVWFYGRASNPMGFGLSHIVRADNDGTDWVATEQSFGDDWVGSMKITLADDSNNRQYYVIRNVR